MPNTEIKLLSTTAMKTTVDELNPQFERNSGRKLVAAYAPSAQIAKRIADGEAGDVAIVTSPGLDELIKNGRVVAGTRVDIARSAIGVAVRPGAPRPDITSAAAFTQSLLAAKSIVMSNPVGGGASGALTWAAFEKLGIAEKLRPKITFGPGGPAGLVGLFLMRGEADLGLQQMAELMAVPGVDIVGPAPEGFQNITVFAGGIMTSATDAAAGKTFLQSLVSPAAAAVIKAKGMQPA